MHFDQLLEPCRNGGDTQIPTSWGQGRATFGGLVAAMLYEKIAAAAGTDASLRSLTFSFVAPVASGAVTLSADVLRAGRSVTQVEGRLMQDGKPALAALAAFGSARQSGIRVDCDRAPVFKAPEDCPALPSIPGVVPEFTRHFDYRIARGQLPFSGSSDPQLGGWVRFTDSEDAAVSVPQLLALIDAWPPALLPMLGKPAPASSLTWTLELTEPLPTHGGGDWWQYLAEVEQAADGYGVISARLWDADGKLVAFSRQTVTVFD
ncbi:thioesterase family protein [Microbulbifer sp. SAOS-129_SWC]|uniref:acyl-CoA thioesterase n=1 Tax=Microbulbifer sp. SAOS-129_SWC TaxID=3145235 RepID=UPI0032166795